MRKCPACGYPNDDEALACNLCAARLPEAASTDDVAPVGAEFHEPRMLRGGAPRFVPRAGGKARAEAEQEERAAGVVRRYVVPAVGPPTRVDDGGRVTIGRDRRSTIPLSVKAASRHHAEVRVDGGRASVSDLGSHNGTRVNGERLAARGTRELEDHDVIEVAGVQLVWRVLGPGVPEGELVKDAMALTAAIAAESTPGLAGDAALLPLHEVVRRLEGLGATGTLQVDSGGVKGKLVIAAGRLVTCAYGALDGEAALTAVLALATGRFRYEASRRAPPPRRPPAAEAKAPARGKPKTP